MLTDITTSGIVHRISSRTPDFTTTPVTHIPETASTVTAAADTGTAVALEPSEVHQKYIIITAATTIFSNNICTLDLPYKIQRDNRQGIAHVLIQSYSYLSASAMGNKCSEVLKEIPLDDEDYIFSILAFPDNRYMLKSAENEPLSKRELSGRPGFFRIPDSLGRLKLPAKLEPPLSRAALISWEAAILLGNVTTNRIYPMPDPQNLNLRGW
jgi:hypothetical protein